MTHEDITAQKLGRMAIETIKLEAALYALQAKVKELDAQKLQDDARINSLLRQLTDREERAPDETL